VTRHEGSMPAFNDRSLPLTEGERRALGLSARGLPVPEVAEAMDAPPERVRGLLAAAIEKLGARSKLEAVLIASRRGEIDPAP
jgi:DNA-binding CsgD family transcriptional regulator